MASEGLDIIAAHYVPDLRTVELKPWDRRGDRGVFINHEASRTSNDCYVCEIPAGGELAPQRGLFEEMILVLEGNGSTKVWNDDGAEVTFEWQAGWLFAIPLNTNHQHFNASGQTAARFVASTNLPPVLNLYEDVDFVFGTAHDFRNRFAGQPDYFAPKGEQKGLLLETNFVADATSLPLISAKERGAGGTEIGLLAGSYAVLSFVIAIPTGRWIDRLGEIRFIVAGAAVMATMCFWLFAADQLVLLGVAQALLGAGQLFGLVAVQALLANCGPPQDRDARYGVFAVVASVGQVIGPALGGFVASAAGGSSRHVFLVSGLLGLIAVVNGLSLRRWPPPPDECVSRTTAPVGAPFRAVANVLRIRSMPQAMLASVTVLVTIDLLVAYLPAYGEAYGIPVATVALLLIPLLPQVAALYVLMAVAGFGLGLGQPLSVSWVAGAAPAESRGMALGVRLTGNRLGQMIIPAVVGAVGGATSVVAIFVVLALMLGGSSGIVLTADFTERRS